MGAPTVLKVADHTIKLDKLHADAVGRDSNYEAIDDEFTRVCREIWGFSLNDLSQDAWKALLDKSVEYPESIALQYAVVQGFNLTYSGRPLHDWKAFMLLILAKSYNLAPAPDEVQKLRLEKEASKFKLIQAEKDSSARKRGEVVWAKPHKDFGFIKLHKTKESVFVHKSAMERAGLQLIQGVEVTFDLISNNGKYRAENVQEIKALPRRLSAANSYYGVIRNTNMDYFLSAS